MSARLERAALAAGWGVARLVVEGGGALALARDLRQLARHHTGPRALLLLDAEQLVPPFTSEGRDELVAAAAALWRAGIDLAADPESPTARDLLGAVFVHMAPPSAPESSFAGNVAGSACPGGGAPSQRCRSPRRATDRRGTFPSVNDRDDR